MGSDTVSITRVSLLSPTFCLDYTQMCNLQYDLTNRYLVKLNLLAVNQGSDPKDVTAVTKFLAVHRETTMREFYHETAAIPIMVKGRSFDRKYSSIVYSIEDNHFTM